MAELSYATAELSSLLDYIRKHPQPPVVKARTERAVHHTTRAGLYLGITHSRVTLGDK
jgi:hypothetical protein